MVTANEPSDLNTTKVLDLNLGCPQEAARDAHYGAYLLGLKDWPLVNDIGKYPDIKIVSIAYFYEANLETRSISHG